MRSLPLFARLYVGGVIILGLGLLVVCFPVETLSSPWLFLLLLALYGLAVVPIVYLVNPLSNVGGANFGYAQHYIGAHWVAVGVVCVLLWALVLWLRELRHPPPAAPTDAAHGPP